MDNILVINLDHDTAKWEATQKEFQSVGHNPTRISATYGKTMNTEERVQYTSPWCRWFCTDAIIGCGSSHLRCWEHMVQHNMNWVLICEDDIVLTDNFNEKMQTLLHRLETEQDDWDMVYLYCIGLCTSSGLISNLETVSTDEQMTLFRPTFPTSTASYLLSRRGAEKLIQLNQKVRFHIDIQIAFSTLFKGMNIMAVYPYFVTTSYEDSATSSSDSFIVSRSLNFKPEPNHPTMAWNFSENIIHFPGIDVALNGTDIVFFLVFWKLRDWIQAQCPTIDYKILITIFLLIDHYVLGNSSLTKVFKKIMFHVGLLMWLESKNM